MGWEQRASKRADYEDAFPGCERTFAELCIYSDSIGPEEMTARLELVPTKDLKKGRVWITAVGTEKTQRFNAFFLSSENAVASLDLRRHLDWLLARLAGHEPGLFELLATEEVHASIDCVWWLAEEGARGGPVLRADQLAAVADLGLELSVDFSVIF